MTDTDGPLAAKMNLALSRAELLAAMGCKEVLDGHGDARIEVLPPDPLARPSGRAKSARFAPWLQHWWRRQPLRDVAELSLPLVEHYGQAHPGRLVAYGAGAGALLALVRPWRLLSAVTLAGVIFKTLASPGRRQAELRPSQL
jgi:hypothetical protein